MDRNILLSLLKEENYPVQIIESTINKLEKLQPEVLTVFMTWIADGKTPTFSVAGYSFTVLTNDYGMKPIGAFLTLDWLIRDPENAILNLKRGIK